MPNRTSIHLAILFTIILCWMVQFSWRHIKIKLYAWIEFSMQVWVVGMSGMCDVGFCTVVYWNSINSNSICFTTHTNAVMANVIWFSYIYSLSLCFRSAAARATVYRSCVFWVVHAILTIWKLFGKVCIGLTHTRTHTHTPSINFHAVSDITMNVVCNTRQT